MASRTRLLLAAVVVLFVAGVTLAIAKPGNLADDNGTKTAAATTTTSEPVTTTAQATTSSSSAPTTTEAPTTTIAAAGGGGGSGTGGSGLGTGGSGSSGKKGLASTGGVSFALPGAALLVLALSTRRLARR